jgi:predicted ATP-grasp superfamily ATP-dependent carboligase
MELLAQIAAKTKDDSQSSFLGKTSKLELYEAKNHLPKIENEVPVMILETYDHWGLGILRSLGRLGIRVYVAASNRSAPAFFSKYCRGRFLLNIREPANYPVQALLSIGSKIGCKSILIPTSDEGVVFVADHAAALREWYMFPNQTASLVRSLCSKKEMYHTAKRFHIPTPEAAFPQNKDDVLAFLNNASFPVMLKAIYGWRTKPRTSANVIVHSDRELLEKYAEMENPGEPNLMLQEYIPGGDASQWMFNCYFNERSDCLFGITGQKIRQWPSHGGVCSLGICLRNETVKKTTLGFMKAVGYKGILNIGYRYDARDGQYKVLDINPRIGATFRLFVDDKGNDVARSLYLDMTGQPMTPGVAQDGRKWFVEDLDLESYFLHHLEGNLGFREWINSYRGVREAAYFSLDDLLPFLQMLEFRLGMFLIQGRRPIGI